MHVGACLEHLEESRMTGKQQAREKDCTDVGFYSD